MMTTEVVKPKKESLPVSVEDFPVDGRIIELACRNLDFKTNHLASIIRNKSRVVLKLPKGDFTNAYLASEIKKIAMAYGGDKEVSAIVQRECVKALQNEFKNMSVAEIWIAFRLHSAGELGDKKGRGEMYGGKMTAKAFSAVLSAWKAHKAQAVANYIKEQHDTVERQEHEKRAERMRRNFWPQLVVTLRKLKEDPEIDWRGCPSYIFDALRKKGIIDVSEVWKPIWEEAQQLARQEVSSENTKDVATRGKIRLMGEVAAKESDRLAGIKAKKIAKKLSLLYLVIKNNEFNLDSITKQLYL